jgi:glycerophosphoryl diester phosphodiesterase
MRAAALGAALVAACAGGQPVKPKLPFQGVVGPLIIGHRGGSLEAPENTLAAIRHAVSVGADWQEIDVTLSADDVAVVIHDDTLDRTTDGKGDVTRQPFDALKKLSAGRPRWSDESRRNLATFGVTPPDFGTRYASERIPTLEEVLSVPGTRVMIEMKQIEKPRVARLVQRVVEAVHATRAADRVVLASFETDLLWAANAREPSLPLMGIAEAPEAIETMLELPVQVIAVRVDLVPEAVRQSGGKVSVWAWTAYTPDMARAAVEQGAHGIITDVPQAVIAALRPDSGHLVEMPH